MIVLHRFSGICAAAKLKQESNFQDITIFDKNSDFGGTWLSHTYTGCACDVPSSVYSFNYELNPGKLSH